MGIATNTWLAFASTQTLTPEYKLKYHDRFSPLEMRTSELKVLQ